MFLGVEDELSEAVGRAILRRFVSDNAPISVLRKQGAGYLRGKMSSFMQIADRDIVVVMTDLDQTDCAPALRSRWVDKATLPARMSFRIAVRETEAWLLADRESIASFFGISPAKVPKAVEEVQDAKERLLHLAREARREVRTDLLPAKGSRARQGLGYNERLTQFVEQVWNVDRASENADSLARAVTEISSLRKYI